MKVNGPGPSGPVNKASGPAKASSGGFSLQGASGTSEAAPSARVSDTAPLSSLEALIALQEVSTATERKKRAVKRASRLLDALDQIKVALLEGSLGESALADLAKALKEAREDTEDPGLEALISEIETRAAVELAKRGRSG